ncbi:MAG: GAF domain-containing sensor histidine kinase [Anaerolineae bacterium]|nr:GAF domain-containing sensor histidine kinase [Anaerolineae bacterium]
MNIDYLTQSANSEETVRNYLELMGRYERLMEISRQLNSTLELKALLQAIIEAATELTDTEVASILLIDPASGELRFEAGINPSSKVSLETFVVPMEGSIAGWIVRHGEPVLIEDVANHPSHFSQIDSATDFSTRNMLGVPLRTHDKTTGALEAINKRNDGAFSEDDVNTLTALAAQAAVAIENARLFQQSDLIAEMVHELRAPLNAIRATAHLLSRPDLPEDRRAVLVETIRSETERLNNMTTDFLDLARLESGRTRLTRETFEVAKLVDECVQVVQSQANERKLQISTQINEDVSLLYADRGKLKQVLLNLLTNAIKYNRDEGRIDIYAELVSGKSPMRIAVADTGVGISAENQKRMFQRFYRVADTEGYAQGTGLGLVIAKRIVEAHEGEMWLESELGAGTTFYFTIPIIEEEIAPPVVG